MRKGQVMLSFDDAHVVERDLALPGLRVLLDDAALGEWCRRHGFSDVLSTTSVYARYKPGTSCVVQFQLTTPRGTEHAYATCFSYNSEHKIAKALEYVAESDLHTRCVAVDTQQFIAVYRWPCDRELAVLERLADADTSERIFAKVLKLDAPRLRTVLRYKPERRAVMHLSTRLTDVLVKGYSENEFPRALACAGDVQAFVNSPKLLGVSERHRLLCFEWQQCSPDAVTTITDAGSLLAALHTSEARFGETSDEKAVTNIVAASVSDMQYLCPLLTVRLQSVAQQTSAMLSAVIRATPQPVPLHGDCSADQFISTSAGTMLTDFDNACMGHPMQDVGNFLTKLWLHQFGCQHPAQQSANSAADHFMNAYKECVGVVDASALKAFQALALLRIATDGFRNRRPNWRAELERIVTRAEEVLHEH